MRIIHVATMMGSGGLEKWLVDLAARMRHDGHDSTIIVQHEDVGVHGLRARDLGLPVVFLPGGRFRFLRSLRHFLRVNGPFDVVHSHVHYYSGAVLAVAKAVGVPVRVAHAHNDLSSDPSPVIRRLYVAAMRAFLRVSATAGFGVSKDSAVDLFGSGFGGDPRWSVLPCGIEIHHRDANVDRRELKSCLGLPADSKVAVQVGRLVGMKNQEFSIRLVAAAGRSDLHLVLIGDGPDLQMCSDLAGKLGIQDRVHLPGTRSDVGDILRNVADVFLFPSRPGEGAPIALIEAQAAGVPCIVSDHVQQASVVAPQMVSMLPLSGRMDAWIREMERILEAARPNVEEAEAAVLASAFSLEDNVRRLESIYDSIDPTPSARLKSRRISLRWG
jgi:glycosyltransferase involved in cell wall biosynthesis